jgi:hypothetical protein
MRKWEYTEGAVRYFPDGQPDFISRNGVPVLFEQAPPDRHAYLNSLGQDGWELVNVYLAGGQMEIYHFKRPVD